MATSTPGGKKRRPGSRKRPVWERGYQSHGYWLGKECVGRVRLGAKGEWDGIYRWEAGTNTGEARTLGEAKRQVEEKVLLGLIQLPLF